MTEGELKLELPMLENAQLDRLALAGKALADQTRLQMLQLMAQGRTCCGLPSASSLLLPGAHEPEGICVCEFGDLYGMGQSKVSYHLRILKEAGLVREEVRGKWTFYSVNKPALRELIAHLQRELAL